MIVPVIPERERRPAGPVRLSFGRLIALALAATIAASACSALGPLSNTQSGTLTPRQFLPSFQTDSSAANPASGTAAATAAPVQGAAVQRGPAWVLFVQGDHVPQNGYSQGRVRDDGKKPESFTHLRTEVLEADLKLSSDEFVLTKNNKIDATLLAKYGIVVLGSNARLLRQDEVKALTDFYNNGGSILTYADSQFGPNNWDSDNSFLNQFGIEVLTDNLQPAINITDIDKTHPIMAGVKAIRGEGLSQFLVSAATLGQNHVIAKCSPLNGKGCILQPSDRAKPQKGDVVACVVVRENDKGGRLAGVCDRNFFQNGPGPGSDLNQLDNRLFARNLFRWLSKQ